MISVDATALIVLGIVFGLVLVLKNWLFEPLATAVEKREELIERAEGAWDEAERTIEQARRQVAQAVQAARNEGYGRLDQVRSEAQASARSQLDAARVDAQERIADSRERLRVESETAVRELESQVSQLAASIASRILGREVA